VQDAAGKYVEHPEMIESADTTAIRKLLTTHVRKDQFCEGHLAAMFENGHIVALLRRLKAIRPIGQWSSALRICSQVIAKSAPVQRPTGRQTGSMPV